MTRLLFVFCAAAVFADEVIEIFFSVIVREFFTCLDVSARVNEHLVSNDFNLAVWSTRVVYVSRNIMTSFSVDGSTIFEIEQIFSTATMCFVVNNEIAKVFHNESTFSNGFIGKNTKTRCAPFYREIECGFSRRVWHRRKDFIIDALKAAHQAAFALASWSVGEPYRSSKRPCIPPAVEVGDEGDAFRFGVRRPFFERPRIIVSR